VKDQEIMGFSALYFNLPAHLTVHEIFGALHKHNSALLKAGDT
jgi:hypothetical protein